MIRDLAEYSALQFYLLNKKMIRDLAERTIRGDFGNGQERRFILGPLYAPVQNEVNRQLGYSKRHYW